MPWVEGSICSSSSWDMAAATPVPANSSSWATAAATPAAASATIDNGQALGRLQGDAVQRRIASDAEYIKHANIIYENCVRCLGHRWLDIDPTCTIPVAAKKGTRAFCRDCKKRMTQFEKKERGL